MINSYGDITMDYQRHYDLLIERAKQRTTDLYTERHHIVPRCLGGTDEQDNLVALTPEEHYVAHQLLIKIHPDNKSLVYAAIMMIPKSCSHSNRSNKMYGWLRRKYQTVCKQRVGAKNGSYGKPWYYNPETGESKKYIQGTQPEGWQKGRVMDKNSAKKYCKSCGLDLGYKTNKIYCKPCKEKVVPSSVTRWKKETDFKLLKFLYDRHLQGESLYKLSKEYNKKQRMFYLDIKKLESND